jgi:hypothetical protein
MKGLIAFVVSIVVSIAAPLRAGDIQVTGGYLDVSVAAGTGPLVLFGDRGFTFRANVVVSRGNFEPCNPCMPGSVVSLGALWSGDDLTGVATLDGITYPDVGAGGVSVNAMTVSFSGSAVLPALGTSSTIVSAPFLLSGMFRHGAVDTLHGLGTATLFLSPHPGAPGAWRMDRVLYRLASLLPPPWDSVDIGAGAPGFAGYVDGTFYVQGDGGDIWGTADAFRFVYQPVAGDADIIARVTMRGRESFAKAGFMFRQSLDPSSLQVILDWKPSGELEFMTRFSTGDITTASPARRVRRDGCVITRSAASSPPSVCRWRHMERGWLDQYSVGRLQPVRRTRGDQPRQRRVEHVRLRSRHGHDARERP